MIKPEPLDPTTPGRSLVRFLTWCIFAALVLFIGGTAAAIYFLEQSPPPTTAFMLQSRAAAPARLDLVDAVVEGAIHQPEQGGKGLAGHQGGHADHLRHVDLA